MASNYQLSYTASEIDERLGRVLPEITSLDEGKIPCIIDSELVYINLSDLEINGKKFNDYIISIIDAYISEALRGDY